MQLREEKIRAGKGNTQLERGRKERHKKKISIFLFSQLSKYCEQRLLCGLICCTKPAEITKDGCWRRFSQRCLLSALRRFFLASKHFILCSLELNFEALQHWKSCILSTQKKEKEGEVWLSGTGTTFPNAEIIYSSNWFWLVDPEFCWCDEIPLQPSFRAVTASDFHGSINSITHYYGNIPGMLGVSHSWGESVYLRSSL